MLVYGQNEEVAGFVADRVELGGGGFGNYTAIGVANDAGRLIAGVVYNDYQPMHGTIQLTIASNSPMWARRENIFGLLAYPFLQLKVFKAWTAAPHDNRRSLRLTDRLGFKREAVLAHGFGFKRHAVVSRMLAPDFARLFMEGVRHG